MSIKDEILQALAEHTEAVKSGNTDPAVFDWDEAERRLGKLIDAKLADENDAKPVRKGDPIKADQVNKDLKGNRYAKMIKDIEGQGFYRSSYVDPIKAWDVHAAHLLLTKGHSLMPERVALPSNELTLAMKALSSTGTGIGDELVPTNWAGELWEDVHLANVLVSNLVRVPMTSNPQTVPNALGDVTFAKGTENVVPTAQDPATSNQDLTVTELLAEVDWSYSLEEDAVVAMMPAIRGSLARNAAEYMDGFAYNADSTTTATGNVNSDDGAPAATRYYLTAGQDGIRHQWIVDNATQATAAGGDALTDADITSTLVKMGKYAVDPRQLLIVCDLGSYHRGFLNATTTSSPGTFVTSIGDVGYSIIATGQIGSYRNIPIVLPVLAPKTMADGKLSVTASSNTLGQISILNRTQWRVGFIRDMEIEVDRDIQKRQIIMVVSFREAIGCRGTRSSATHTAGINNILVT